MMNSGGEGGLGVKLQMKTFTKFGEEFNLEKNAKKIASGLELSPEKLETRISKNETTGKFIVWYRERS